MSSNIEILDTDEKPPLSPDEKQDHDTSNPGTPKDGDQWRHGIDRAHEKRILRKLDLHSLPFVSLLFLMANL
jgi:hypothetical protein